MGVSSLIQHFRKAFIKYAIALALLFTLAAFVNISYQVYSIHQRSKVMMSESIQSYLTQRADANRNLASQLLDKNALLTGDRPDQGMQKNGRPPVVQRPEVTDLTYLSNQEASIFSSDLVPEETFLAQLNQVDQGAILDMAGRIFLFSMTATESGTMVIAEEIDRTFVEDLIKVLPVKVSAYVLNGNLDQVWNESVFSIPLAESGITLAISTQLDINMYVIQSFAIPALIILIGGLLIYRMFKQETRWINPLIQNTRTALQEIGMGQRPSLPDSEMQEAALLYESVQALFDQLKIKDTQVKQSHLEMIELLNAAIGTNDAYTNGHSQRVETLTSEFGAYLHYQQADSMEVAARLHDIGKIGIPTQVLNKPGRLNDAEFDLIKAHPVKGAEILTRSEFFKDAVPLVRHHHEHWDGSGYPDGLKGPEIPLGAQILAMSDVYDALTSKRPYRDALSHQEALAIIKGEAGAIFNPVLTDQFISFFQNKHRKKFITSLYEL